MIFWCQVGATLLILSFWFISIIYDQYKVLSGVDCWRAGACFSSPYLLGIHWVFGSSYASCVNIDEITVLRGLCSAEFGCAISEIAEYSCACSEVKGNEYGWRTFIPIYGTLALYPTHIYSNGYSANIRMYCCYYGYNNTLHCESGDSCSVACYGNECFGFGIDCVTIASCSVSRDITTDVTFPNGYGGGTYDELRKGGKVGFCPNIRLTVMIFLIFFTL